MQTRLRLLSVAAVFALTCVVLGRAGDPAPGSSAGPAAGELPQRRPPGSTDEVPGRYVVLLKRPRMTEAVISSLQGSALAAGLPVRRSGAAVPGATGSAFSVISALDSSPKPNRRSDRTRGLVIQVNEASLTDAALAALNSNVEVAAVLPDFIVRLSQSSSCAPASTLAGVSVTPTPGFWWPGCYDSGSGRTKLIWVGERCGPQLNQIQWTVLYAVNRITGELVPGCTKYPASVDPKYNSYHFGSCAIPPEIAALPTQLCGANTGNKNSCAKVSAGVATATGTMLSDSVMRCSNGAKTSAVLLSGSPCGPSGQFVRWDRVSPLAYPGSRAACGPNITRSSTNPLYNAQWLGSCGVPPAALRSLPSTACAAPLGSVKPEDTSAAGGSRSINKQLKRVLAASSDVVPLSELRVIGKGLLQRLYIPDVSSAPFKAAVAVMDTGVSNHTDLNVVGGASTVDGFPNPYEDLNGHGTHVAGTIAAKNGGGYIVGMSPGAPVVSVRILTGGHGGGSDMIAGIYWLIDNAKRLGVKVVNLSVSSRLTSRQVVRSYCSLFDELADVGVTAVVAAGNDGGDFTLNFPAGCPNVLTVTAMQDLDGAPSGDDVAAIWSNYLNTTVPDYQLLQNTTIAAPGWRVTSLLPFNVAKEGMGVKSGTSQATPHVAGTLLNCYLSGACTGLAGTPAAAKATAAAKARAAQDPEFGFKGDPDRPLKGNKYYGYLLDASAF